MIDKAPADQPVVCPIVDVSIPAWTPLLTMAIDTEAEAWSELPELVVREIARPRVVLSPPASACTATFCAVTLDCTMFATVMSLLIVTATAPAMPTLLDVPGAPFARAAAP